jgi:hypothetical protein
MGNFQRIEKQLALVQRIELGLCWLSVFYSQIVDHPRLCGTLTLLANLLVTNLIRICLGEKDSPVTQELKEKVMCIKPKPNKAFLHTRFESNGCVVAIVLQFD